MLPDFQASKVMVVLQLVAERQMYRPRAMLPGP